MLSLRYLRMQSSVSEEDEGSSVLNVPADVEEEWLKIVENLVKNRVKQLSEQGRIELFCDLEKQNLTISDSLTSIIMVEAVEALNIIALHPVS